MPSQKVMSRYSQIPIHYLYGGTIVAFLLLSSAWYGLFHIFFQKKYACIQESAAQSESLDREIPDIDQKIKNERLASEKQQKRIDHMLYASESLLEEHGESVLLKYIEDSGLILFAYTPMPSKKTKLQEWSLVSFVVSGTFSDSIHFFKMIKASFPLSYCQNITLSKQDDTLLRMSTVIAFMPSSYSDSTIEKVKHQSRNPFQFADAYQSIILPEDHLAVTKQQAPSQERLENWSVVKLSDDKVVMKNKDGLLRHVQLRSGEE